MSNDAFLPPEYEVPSKAGSYSKFEDGDNRFRFLASPIIGWVGWKTQPDGGRKPVRKHMNETISVNEVDNEDQIKHFWAMPVYNYRTDQIEILEITQKGIQKAIKSLVNDSDWGSPINYDIVINKKGQKLETEYQVMPKPAKQLDPGIKQAFEDMFINLNALYEGKDPFKEDLADDAVKAGL